VLLTFIAVLWIGLLEFNGIYKEVYGKIISSIVLSVYLSDDVIDSDIEELKKITDEYDEIYVDKIEKPVSAVEKKEEYPDFKSYLDSLGKNFYFPGLVQIKFKHIDNDKILNILERFKKLDYVQEVKYSAAAFEKFSRFFKTAKIARIFVLAVFIMLIIFLLYLSGFLYVFSNYKDVRVCKEYAIDLNVMIFSAIRERFILGIFAGIIGSLFCYIATVFFGLEFYVGLLKTSIVIISMGILSCFFYLKVCKRIISVE
jgi:cell division protein FtsX